jgi:hypothetical protein
MQHVKSQHWLGIRANPRWRKKATTSRCCQGQSHPGTQQDLLEDANGLRKGRLARPYQARDMSSTYTFSSFVASSQVILAKTACHVHWMEPAEVAVTDATLIRAEAFVGVWSHRMAYQILHPLCTSYSRPVYVGQMLAYLPCTN